MRHLATVLLLACGLLCAPVRAEDTDAVRKAMDAAQRWPKGEYVVIQYASAYTNRPKVIETVTPMLEKDGTWRVSGYFVK